MVWTITPVESIKLCRAFSSVIPTQQALFQCKCQKCIFCEVEDLEANKSNSLGWEVTSGEQYPKTPERLQSIKAIWFIRRSPPKILWRKERGEREVNAPPFFFLVERWAFLSCVSICLFLLNPNYLILSSFALIAIFISSQRSRVEISRNVIEITDNASIQQDVQPLGRIIKGNKVATIIDNQPLDILVPLILHFSAVLGPEWPIIVFTGPSAET